MINISVTNLVLELCKQCPAAPWVDDFLLFGECNTSIATFHRSKAGISSIRKPASNEIISDSVELRDTARFLLAQMFDFRKYKRFFPSVIWCLQDLQQNLSLGINPIDNAELCFPHDNIFDSPSCDACRKSDVQSVCHKLLSIL